jgi:hypothetical protein
VHLIPLLKFISQSTAVWLIYFAPTPFCSHVTHTSKVVKADTMKAPGATLPRTRNQLISYRTPATTLGVTVLEFSRVTVVAIENQCNLGTSGALLECHRASASILNQIAVKLSQIGHGEPRPQRGRGVDVPPQQTVVTLLSCHSCQSHRHHASPEIRYRQDNRNSLPHATFSAAGVREAPMCDSAPCHPGPMMAPVHCSCTRRRAPHHRCPIRTPTAL